MIIKTQNFKCANSNPQLHVFENQLQKKQERKKKKKTEKEKKKRF